MREQMTWEDLGTAVDDLAAQIRADGFSPDAVLALARGGLPCAGALAYALGVKNMATLNVEFYTGVDERLDEPLLLPPVPDLALLRAERLLVVDDVADTGRTLALASEFCAQHGPGGTDRRPLREAAECRPVRFRLAADRPLDQLSVEHAGSRGGLRPAREGLHRQRHGGRRRDRQVAADGRDQGEARLPRRSRAVYGRDQCGRARRAYRGCDGDRRHGLPRRGRGVDVQLAYSRQARSAVASTWCRTTGPNTRSCSSRDATPLSSSAMHAKAGTPDGVMSATRSRAKPGRVCSSTACPSERRGSTPRSAGSGTVRCCSSRATRRRAGGHRAARDGLTTVAVKKGLGRFSARQLPPLKAREMIEDGASVRSRISRP